MPRPKLNRVATCEKCGERFRYEGKRRAFCSQKCRNAQLAENNRVMRAERGPMCGPDATDEGGAYLPTPQEIADGCMAAGLALHGERWLMRGGDLS